MDSETIEAVANAYFLWRQEPRPDELQIHNGDGQQMSQAGNYLFELPRPDDVSEETLKAVGEPLDLTPPAAPDLFFLHFEAAPVHCFSDGLNLAWVAYSPILKKIAIGFEGQLLGGRANGRYQPRPDRQAGL